MKRSMMKWTGVALLAVSAAAGLGLAGGCTQFFAWSMASFWPAPKVKALYEPPKDKKILVFVDDKPSPVAYEQIKHELAARVSRKLIDEKIVKETIPYDRVVDLSMSHDYNRLSIAEVGQRLGAEWVLYVQIEAFSLRDDPSNPLWKGRLETSVWIVDTAKPERLWPKDVPDRYGYHVPAIELKHSENPSPTYGEEIAKLLSEQMADKIVDLFHDHEGDDSARFEPEHKQNMD